MLFLKRVHIRRFEVGLHFRDGEFQGLLSPGRYWMLYPWRKQRVDVVSQRSPQLIHDHLDEIYRAGVLKDRATVVDLTDRQRALVWIDDRLHGVLGPGLHAFWTGLCNVRLQIVDTDQVRFEHPQRSVILHHPSSDCWLENRDVPRHHAGVLYVEGRYVETLTAGVYSFWRRVQNVRLDEVDLRETFLDIAGQDIMTADKVSLRINAVVGFQVTDAHQAVRTADDYRQVLYREAQLALRAVLGARELDAFLSDKDAVVDDMLAQIRPRAEALGLAVPTIGIRDVILPGEMKDLMNRVTEAKKASEANLIARREETAAMRSQANTAKLLADNPTLMRLRELEVLEKIASHANMNVVLGERGLADRVINLL